MSDKLVVDLDGTLALSDRTRSYADLDPDQDLVQVLRDYRTQGYEIVIYTSRNMRTHANNVGRINARTLPVIVEWLNRHDIPHDEIHVGKPWCGETGFYIDDRAVRPSEVKGLSEEEVQNLLESEKGR